MTNQVNAPQIQKLIFKISNLITELDKEKGLDVHYRVNQFYYMQKNEELKLQLDQLMIAEEQVRNSLQKIQSNYEQAFRQWQKDIRWMNRHRTHAKK